jgi:serpin B
VKPRRHRSRQAAATIGTAALAATLLAGCGSNPASNATVLSGHVEPVHAGTTTAAAIAADNTTFGLALMRRLCAADPGHNETLSPASAAQALGMLAAGSVGRTQAQVAHLLGVGSWDADVVAALHAQHAALARISQVAVSNHVFEQKGVTPTAQTLDDLDTAYGADLRQVDFMDEPKATDAINGVIRDDTNGLIPTLFDTSLPTDTQTVVANAISLDAKWQDPFPSMTPGAFHTAAGATVTTPLMRETEGAFASREAAGWQSVVLPYSGGKLQAVALLPPSSAGQDAACPLPSAATLSALTGGPSQPVGVILPKLNLSQTLPLTKTLAAMGLPLTGDYSGLGAADTKISEVVQKVVMMVDQNGTKAAAATGGVATSGAVEGQTSIVDFNRPFLLVLEDTATHTPLFFASVANPTSS